MGSPRLTTRAKVVKLAGQPKKWRGSKRLFETVDDSMISPSQGTVSRVTHSRYWGVRFAEQKDKYGPVKVYGPDGQLAREIPLTELERPFPVDPRKSTWNTMMYTRKSMGLY